MYTLTRFASRLFLTTIVFIALKLKNFSSVPILLIILLVSDHLDANAYFLPTANGSFYLGSDILYQKYDKICDWLLYLVFLLLFKNLFESSTQKLLFVFLFWRLIGVIAFSFTGNYVYLKIFADFINTTIMAYIIYQYFSLSKNWYYVLIAISIVGKLIFEQILHNH